ncbi:hypothetical protein HUJ05_004711 [Dendroctonus ponderosae]|nr:hypothetical protein HUJ05_004711 [Dendroctonus ponderosae]
MVLYGAQNGFQSQLPKKNRKWGRNSYGNNYPFVQRLISHFYRIPIMKVYEVLRKSARTVVYLMTRTNFFDDFDKTVGIFLVGGLLVRHYFQAQMNCTYLKSHHIEQEPLLSRIVTGKAICPTIALLNHSCYPNAVIMSCGDQFLVRALTTIAANEEITVCYHPIRPLLTLADRRLLMESLYYFFCPCVCKMCIWQNILKDHGTICIGCARKYAEPNVKSYTGTIETCLSCIEVQDVYTPFEKTALEFLRVDQTKEKKYQWFDVPEYKLNFELKGRFRLVIEAIIGFLTMIDRIIRAILWILGILQKLPLPIASGQC